MHLPVFVVYGGALLQALAYGLVVYHYLPLTSLGVHYHLKDVEEFAAVASAVTQEGVAFLQENVALTQHLVVLEGAVKQGEQVLFRKTLEYENLAAGQKGSDNLE